MKQLKIYLLFFFLAFLACSEPVPLVSWKLSFDGQSKSPFGLYVMENELPELFKQADIHIIDEPTTDFFLNRTGENYTKNEGYILIQDELPYDDDLYDAMRKWVSEGNTVFISTAVLPDWRGLEMNYEAFAIKKNEKLTLILGQDAQNASYEIHKKVDQFSFFTDYSQGATLLGIVDYQKEKRPNYIVMVHGSGYFYIHLEPFVFTNEHLLYDDKTYQYVEECLSFLPQKKIHWDNNNFRGRNGYGHSASIKVTEGTRPVNQEDVEPLSSSENNSKEHSQNGGEFFDSLNLIFQHPALKWAFFIFLAGIFSYIIFNSKRRQRVIPVLKPFQNDHLKNLELFTNLHRRESNHAQLAQQRIHYFMDYIRTRYAIIAKEMDEEFEQRLSAKTGYELKDTQTLVQAIKRVKASSFVNNKELVSLHQLLSKFYKHKE